MYHRVGLYAKSLRFADPELAWNQSARTVRVDIAISLTGE